MNFVFYLKDVTNLGQEEKKSKALILKIEMAKFKVFPYSSN